VRAVQPVASSLGAWWAGRKGLKVPSGGPGRPAVDWTPEGEIVAAGTEPGPMRMTPDAYRSPTRRAARSATRVHLRERWLCSRRRQLRRRVAVQV